MQNNIRKINSIEILVKEFLNDYSMRFRPGTLESYEVSLRYFYEFCSKSINEVRRKDIEKWQTELQNRGLSGRTIRLKLAALRSFLDYCVEEGYILANPMLGIKPPKIRKTVPRPLTKKELFLLREATKNNARDRAIIETFYATGMRVSELINVRLEDVRFDLQEIWVRDGKGAKERTVLFSAECKARLQLYFLKRNPLCEPYLFCTLRKTKFTRMGFQTMIRRCVKKAGIDKKISAHCLRHSFATYLLSRGADIHVIKELMGHKSISTTILYVDAWDILKTRYDEFV